MAYSDFVSISQLEDQFGISQNLTRLFVGVRPVSASATLTTELYESASLPLLTEKAKSEFLIAPILKEIRRLNNFSISVFSGYNFDVEAEKGLVGFCDYLFSTETHSIDIKAPVFCVVEAKNRTVEEGLAQAGASMIAASVFNARKGTGEGVIYGCVTTAYEWVFLRLQDNILDIDITQRYSLEEHSLPYLLGVIQHIVEQFLD
ncbi:MAG: hypothetical protein EAZ91_03370 [Cytophagales bacterium]|nr:MAG: hypothetical protein EAZ91_03370 [Cytophagales bacterium]